ncbi:MAG: hypothetical protein AAGF28_02095 [Pseudomonadota bacterium]
MTSDALNKADKHVTQVPLRDPNTVMRLDRMGSFFPTRLSFLRSLLRDLADEERKPRQAATQWDEDGFGHAVFEADLHGRTYSLIGYTAPLSDDQRTDRVIAEAWDACFALFDGVPTPDDIARIRDNALVQEAGEYDDDVLVLSRANRSVRLFDHVVDALAQGRQPDAERLASTGYLMRTTAVYGNGKFGISDRKVYADRPKLSHPFRLEMLTVYLIREFTLALTDHVARAKGGATAVALARSLREQLGIGNSTGLGMAPFLVGHPELINNWMVARETALARVRSVPEASAEIREAFQHLCAQTQRHLAQWSVDDVAEQARIEALRDEWDAFQDFVPVHLASTNPWDRLVDESALYSLDLQELLIALVLEPHGELIDDLCESMEAAENAVLDPTMTVGELKELLATRYSWALEIDIAAENANAMAWYVSQEKLEPRLGDAEVVSSDSQKMPHDLPHQIQTLSNALDTAPDEQSLAEFLAIHGEHRHVVLRAQTVARHPYGEVQDNLIDADMRPIDLLRCKLSFFGASRFDPRSDRWTRITLYQGAPTADDLSHANADSCFLPAFDVQNTGTDFR